MLIADPIKRKIVDCNQAAEKIFGYGKKKLLSMRADELHPKDKVKQATEGFKQLALGKIKYFETEILAKNKRIIPVSISASKINLEGKDFLLGTFRDITEQKKVEETLKESENKYKTLIESSPDCIKLFDLNQNLVFINEGGKKEHNLKSAKDIKNFKPMGTVIKEDRYKFQKAIQDAIKGNPSLIEIRHTKEGSNREVCSEAIVPIKNDKGKVVNISGVSRDITEQKKAEDALKESEGKYRDLFENANELIQSVKPDGSFDYVNNKWKDLLGYSDKEIKNLKFTDILRKDMVPHCMNIFKKLAEGEKFQGVKTVFLAKNGKEIIVSGDLNANIINGKFIATRGIFSDITEKKKDENALKESEEKFKTLFESSRDAIMTLFPPSWKFTSGNLSTVKLFNTKDEKEFISLGPWQVSPKYQTDGKLSADKAKEMIMSAMKKGSNFFEWTHCTKQGKPFSATVLLTRIKLGGQMGLQATVRDITEQKKAEQEITFKNALLEAQSDSSVEGILVINSEGKTILSNKTFQKMWHLPQELIDSKDDDKMLGFVLKELENPTEFISKVKYLYEHKEESSREEISLVDGRSFDRYSAPFKAKGGTFYGRIWYFRDITDIRKAELETRKFNEFAIGREIKMVELKKEINALLEQLGEKPKYSSLNTKSK